MFINTKYFGIQTNESYLEIPPKIYIDFFIANKKLTRSWNDILYIEIGLFGKCITLFFNWNYDD